MGCLNYRWHCRVQVCVIIHVRAIPSRVGASMHLAEGCYMTACGTSFLVEYTAFYGSIQLHPASQTSAQAELPSKDLQQAIRGHTASLTAHCRLVHAAEVVAGQAACMVAGDHFLGLQGHPEMTAEFMFKDLRERTDTGALPKDVGENALQVGAVEFRVRGFHHHHLLLKVGLSALLLWAPLGCRLQPAGTC